MLSEFRCGLRAESADEGEKVNAKASARSTLRTESELAMTQRGSRLSAKLAISASLMSAVACGQVEGSQEGTRKTVSIYSWWVLDGERNALEGVIATHEKKHPGVKIQNLTGANADEARLQLTTSIETGNPPDSYQANIGQDLMKWVKSNGMNTLETPLSPIDEWVDKQLFYSRIVDQVTAEGKFWAVPVNIHRINTLFFNRSVFGGPDNIPEPHEGMTFDDLLDLCKRIKATKPNVTPLVLGNQSLWELEELVFEDVFPSIAGAEFYESYWRGKENANDARLVSAIEKALLLRDYVNPDYDKFDWAEALRKMMQPSDGTLYAMVAIGDWAKGYFTAKRWGDNQVGSVQFPSAEPTFIYTADSLALPIKDSATHELAAQLLQTFAEKDVQVEFNRLKGSIPARLDIDVSANPSFDAAQVQTYQAWKDPKTKWSLALSGLVPNGLLTGLSDALNSSFTSGDSTVILNYLRRNYSTLTSYGARPQ